MGNLTNLLQWWNLIFLLPIALSVLLLLVSALGGLGEAGGHGGDFHAADLHADTAATGGDAHGGGEGDHEWLHDMLEWMGVGVVPVSLLLQAFLLFFGIFGLAANRALNTGASPDSLVWGALAIAAVGGLGGATGLGAVARRFMPKAQPALGNKDLVGRDGTVIFEVTDASGMIQVRDVSGTLHQVPARVQAGQEPLESGQKIMVGAYDAQRGAFLVEESPFSLTAEEMRRRTS
jgi:hypothetical protein